MDRNGNANEESTSPPQPQPLSPEEIRAIAADAAHDAAAHLAAQIIVGRPQQRDA